MIKILEEGDLQETEVCLTLVLLYIGIVREQYVKIEVFGARGGVKRMKNGGDTREIPRARSSFYTSCGKVEPIGNVRCIRNHAMTAQPSPFAGSGLRRASPTS